MMKGLALGTGGAQHIHHGMAPAVARPTDRPAVRWRDYAGAGSLVVCPALAIGVFAVRYGLSPLVGARAVLALIPLCVVPGYLVQRYAFGLQARSPFETMLSSLLLGTLLSPFLWFAFCVLGLSAVFHPLMFALGVAVPIALGWHRDLPARLKRLVGPAETPVLWLATAMAILWCWQLFLVAHRDGGVVVLPHTDYLIHTTMVAELARGIPPEVVPFLSSAKKWAYHNMPHVWCDMIRRAAGADPREAYFHLALPIRCGLICLACYLALVRRFGRGAATLGAACMLGLAGYHGSRFLCTNWLMGFLTGNFPTGFGFVAVFLILYYVTDVPPERRRPTLLLVSILSGVLFWHKANFALAVMPAVAVFCTLLLARQRDYRWLAVCLAAQALILAIRAVDVATADYRAVLVFEPFRFVGYLWWKGSSWLDAWSASDSAWIAAPIAVLQSIRWRVDGLPDLLKWPTIFAMCMVYLFHLAIPVGVYAAVRCRFGRIKSPLGAVDHLILLILGFCLIGFILFPVQEGLVWNVSWHVFALVYGLIFALMGPVIYDVVGRLLRRGPATMAVTVVVLTGALAANAYAFSQRLLVEVDYKRDVISESLYACYRHVEATTPPDAMILHPQYLHGLNSAGALTLRRCVIERGEFWRLQFDVAPILDDLGAFYRGTDCVTAWTIFDRYDVDYVVMKRSLARTAGYAPFLTEVFAKDDMAVFRTDRRAQRNVTTPGVDDGRTGR